MVKGRQAIQQMWQSTMDSGVTSLSFTVVDVGASGDLAHETGTALLNIHAQGKDPTTASVKYVVVWKRQGATTGNCVGISGTICQRSEAQQDESREHSMEYSSPSVSITMAPLSSVAYSVRRDSNRRKLGLSGANHMSCCALASSGGW